MSFFIKFHFRPKTRVHDANMKAAIAAVHGKRMSMRQAAKSYNIPQATLHRHSSGKYVFTGQPTVLTAEEENQIAAWVIDISKRGFPISPTELKDTVQLYLNKGERTTIFKDNRPGQKWMNAFLKRQPILSIRMAENIDKSRASVTESMIRNWFSKVRTIIFYPFVIAAMK